MAANIVAVVGETDWSKFTSLIQQERTKFMKGKRPIEAEQVMFAHGTEFASISSENAMFSFDKNFQSTMWITDTGASTHMCFNKELLHDLHDIGLCTPVHLSDGTTKIVKQAGTALLHPRIPSADVLYVPFFYCNLLSVNKAVKTSNLRFIFYPQCCLIQDLKSAEVLALGRLFGSLYILDNSSFKATIINKTKNQICASASLQKEMPMPMLSTCNQLSNYVYCNVFSNSDNKDELSTQIWHSRFDHAYASTMKHLYFINHQSCHMAKQHMLPFPTSNIKTTHTFDLIHMDIWGPYKMQTYNGAQYILTLVDDFNRGI